MKVIIQIIKHNMYKRNRRKYIMPILLIGIMIFQVTASFATTKPADAVGEEYEVTSMEEFKEELENIQEDGKITKNEKNELTRNTDPVVIGEFYEEKFDEAFDAVQFYNIDSNMKGDDSYSFCEEDIMLEDNCVAHIEFEDGEEKSLLYTLFEKLIPEAYAATNGETVWKSYGNRYFTARATVQCGVGAAGVALENHYKVSSKGLDERWGDAYITRAMTYGGSISAQNPIISDSSARTESKSDINMYARYPWSFKIGGAGSHGTWKLTTAVKYVRKDSRNKRIRVRHSWTTKSS